MAIILYGQAPGRGGRPGSPPFASGRNGELLARLAGLELEEWRKRVVLINLLPSWPGRALDRRGDLFPMDLARPAADEAMETWQLGDFILLAGRNVAKAFGIGTPYFHWRKVDGIAVSVIPHPSGLNRFWNSPDAGERVSRHLKATLLEAL